MCCAEKSVFDFVMSIIVVFLGMSKQNKKCIYTLEGNLGLKLWAGASSNANPTHALQNDHII